MSRRSLDQPFTPAHDMGTGTSRARSQPASGSSNASQPGATSSGRGGGGGRGGAGGGGGGGGGRGCGRNLVDIYDEWLLSWLASLPAPETYEEENDDNDDDGPAAEGGAGAGAGGEGGAGAEAGGAGGEGGEGGGEGEAPAGGDGGGGGGGGGGGSGSGPATTDTPAQPRLPSLKITGVSLIARFNNHDHKTDDYEYDKSAGRDLIVRRGQEFKIKVLLARPFREKKERILLQFSTKAKVARPMDGTRIALDINGSYKDDDWSAKMDSAEGNTIMVTVKSAPNAIVGSYSLTVKVESKTSGLETIFPQDKKIMVLFNPWCEKDTVYMADNEGREEYVLADSGSIWRGTAERNRPKPWNFGQFDLDVHRVVFELLEKYVSARERRSPAKVSRWFSFIVCEEILEGNWSRNYEGGTSPVMWNGSVKIIEEYARIRDNVKYGQCWVFSGLLTTFLRCVGIPARSVTNFDSAHDTESNMTIDRYLDSEGDKLEEHFFGMVGSSRTVYDSIWNFHVWNEAWMTRPDLDKGYDGWQAVDSTPQEQSEGKYQCGPAPVKAVKEGKVNQGYDTGFVFAEVNADDVRWLVEPFPNHRDGLNFTLLSINKNRTGHVISTKKVGSDDRNDITLEYKHKEGSDKERAAVEEAVSRGINRGIYSDDGKHDDVTISITCKDDLWIGRPFNIEIETKNESDHVQEIRLKTEIDSCDYTGGNKATIKTERMEIVLQGKESVTNTLHIDYNDYEEKMDDEGIFVITVSGRVKDLPKKPIICEHSIRLKQPDLEVSGEVNGSEVKLMVEFENPLEKALTDCEFQVEAPKLVKQFTVKQEDIPAKEKIRREIKFTSRSSGRKTVVVELDSKQLKDINGSVTVEVKLDEPEEEE